MKILELFFGNGSFSRAALDLGHEVVGVGIDPCPDDLKDRITYYECDILDFPFKLLEPGTFAYIWASPPCETYSIAGWHQKARKDCLAITDKGRLHDSYVLRTRMIFNYLSARHTTMENPVACLRKQPFMQDMPRHTVTYCQYGGDRMKKTDLFGRLPHGFTPKACKNGDPCHIASPRGSKNNTDPTVPYDLCRELLELSA